MIHNTQSIPAHIWIAMPLMKSFSYLAEDSTQVFTTEVRRDPNTGLTLAHTYPLFREPHEVVIEHEVGVQLIHHGHDMEKDKLVYDLHADRLTPPPYTPIWVPAGLVSVAAIIALLIIWAQP